MSTWDKVRGVIHDIVLPIILALLTHNTITMSNNKPAPPPPPPPAAAPAPLPPPALMPPPAPQQFDPVSATVRLQCGDRGCTATILSIRPGPGSYYALSASHCVNGRFREGTLTLKDGRAFSFRVVRILPAPDLALLRFDGPDGLPVAAVATGEPPAGVAVWHNGYGVDNPGNKETGTIATGPRVDGQLSMILSVSPGDSGAGVFRADNGQLVSVVCARRGPVAYGASVNAIWRLLKGNGKGA